MKSTTTVRRVTLSVAVVAALTGVAACGSADSGKGDSKASGAGTVHLSPVAAVLRDVEQSTDKADSAKVRATTSMGDIMAMNADGALTWGNGLKGNLDITYTGGKLADSMRKAGTSHMEARYLPDAYYAKMSDAFAQQTGGKHWVKYDFDYLAKVGGASGAYMKDQLQTSTPNQSVKMLLASGDVKKVGVETVDGQHTTHYAGTVDVAALAGKGSNLSADQLTALKQQLKQSGITTDAIDIWVNDQNLLAKKSEKAATANGTLTSTAHYSDYGVAVTAEAPPAADTMDIADMMKSGGVSSPSGGTTSGGTGLSS
ncbi:putative lipoprotein [Streptomyces sp. S816]|uniref:hypothetical protein n=1 Tax=Streptomyces sp. S816 TaxID=2283197 RepID=UPI00109D3F7D|nr:hypothetical protein [Streptomyces sp. S816]TGZ16218.1 putative lipoprotein [Streptomyces sp. S816]